MKRKTLVLILASLLVDAQAHAATLMREARGALDWSNPETQLSDECVILLHGLGRTSVSMMTMANALKKDGYLTENIGYSSRSQPVEELARSAIDRGLKQCRARGATTVHFVTHSMGGILVRQYLSINTVPELGRVVMLAPPNQGSKVADRLMNNYVYKNANGPAGQQLGTGPDGIAALLGPVDFPLGVIAGNERTAIDAVLSEGIDQDSDGKVTLEEAAVEGMSDLRVLPANHTFILSDPQAILEVKHFLREGRFSANQEDVSPIAPNGLQ